MVIIASYPTIVWIVAAIAALSLLAALFALTFATRRKLAGLRKDLEDLSEQVKELHRIEGMRFLKGLRYGLDNQHDLQVAAPSLAPSVRPASRLVGTDR
jgi:hypothetical protein